MRLGKYALLLGLGLMALTGCEKEKVETPKANEVILNVRTVDLANRPVEMVRFYINGKKFGITDQDGRFKRRYKAKDGETLTFNVEPPSGYSVPPDVDQSRWQLTVKYPSDGRPLQVDFTAPLQRPERDYLFMVRAGTPATPVKVNDRLVGKTGPNGDALLRVGGVPGTRFSARAGKVTYRGVFAEDDEVFLLTAQRSGPIGGSKAVAAADPLPVVPTAAPVADVEAAPAVAAEPAKPTEVALAPAPVAPEPTPAPAVAPPVVAPPVVAPPVVVARAPAAQPDPFDGLGQPAAAPRARRRAPVRARTQRFDPEPAAAPDPVVVVDRAPPPRPRRVAPRDRDPIDDLILDDPEPAPPPVVVAPPPVEDPIDDLLMDDEPTPVVAAPAPTVAVAAAPAVHRGRSARDRAESKLGDDLIDDGEAVVDPKAASTKVSALRSGGPSVAAMSRTEISARLSQIKGSLGASRVLGRADVDFLKQIDRTHPGYYESNRLLASFYYSLKDYKKQAKALEIATSRGRLKHDPVVLLSLAKAYAKRKRYRKALSTMRRVESKMRRMKADQKADVYRFNAELLEFEFLRQYHDDPKRANITLVDKAITKWERYQTFSRGSGGGGVAKATKKIAELKDLKGRVEL